METEKIVKDLIGRGIDAYVVIRSFKEQDRDKIEEWISEKQMEMNK